MTSPARRGWVRQVRMRSRRTDKWVGDGLGDQATETAARLSYDDRRVAKMEAV